MSLPSLAQSAMEDKYNESIEMIYGYVEDEIEKFIQEAISYTLYEIWNEYEIDPDTFREDTLECIKDYIKKCEGK